MAEMKHTKGPLFLSEYHDLTGSMAILAVEGDEHSSIGFAHDCMNRVPHETMVANARLWAAASDLLEACQSALALLERDPAEVTEHDVLLMRIVLEGAIAKATGSTPSTAPERLYTFSEVESGARSGILEWVKAHTDWVFPAYYTEHLTNAATRSLRRPDPGATPIDTPARFSEEQVNESLTYVTRIWVQRGHIGDFEADQLRIAALEVLKHPRDGSTPSTGETNNSEQ